MFKFIKILLIVLFYTILPAFSGTADAQATATYGTLVTSLSTTSTGAVSGTSFALPGGAAAVITWNVTYTGSPNPVAVFLECSLDNTTFYTIASSTVIAGDLQTTGFTAAKFCRISQTSKTGAGTTTGTFVTQRGFNLTGNTAGSLGFSDGTSTAPSIFSTSNPTNGFYFPSSTVISPTQDFNVLATKTLRSGLFQPTVSGIAATSTDGVLLNNATAATVSVTAQFTPRFRFCGAAWKSTATAASETDCWIIEGNPVTGSAATTQNLIFGSSLNGSTSYTSRFILSSAGAITSSGGGNWTIGGGSLLAGADIQAATGNSIYWASKSKMSSGTDGFINFTNQAGNGFSGQQYNSILVDSFLVPSMGTGSSGFGSSPVLVAGHDLGFQWNVGIGGSANSGTLTMGGTAPTGWACSVADVTNPGTSNTVQSASTTTTVSVNNYSRTLGTALAWAASDKLNFNCRPF